MKKILFITLIILCGLGAFFYQEIIDTKAFYDFQSDNASTFIEATINWKPMNFSSSDYSAVANQPLTFRNLSIPVPFEATKSGGADSAFALGGTKLISIALSNEAKIFFDTNNFSTKEKSEACNFLAQTSGFGACTSNYNLYRTFLELNETDIHMFSSIADKNLYNRLLTIRANNLENNTISSFETKRIKGFLFTIDSNNYIAKIFDSTDQMYKITFSNMEKAEAAFVLSNITYSK